jgi:cysteine desulfurase family protein
MIYLDNAATTFPKPPAVLRAVAHCMQFDCGNPGRGAHRLSLRAAEHIYACREEIAALIGAPNPERVCFAPNATAAINTVIKGVLHAGDHVLLSDMEHNAVLRPIARLAEEGKITYSIFPTYPTDRNRNAKMLCAGILERIRPNTRLLIFAHASNICSATLPTEELGALCRKRGIFFAVDAAQSAGHMEIDAQRMQIDALCAPGHKGLLGPQGSGFFWLRDGITLDTLTEGGSGFHSLDPHMPADAPERYEAGTLPTPAIAGLAEGVREIRRRGTENIRAHLCRLTGRLQERMQAMERVTVYTPHLIGATLLFNADGIPPDALAAELDKRGFCVRAGYHCAPLAHKTLGTPDGGAVRVSPSIYTTEQQIDAFSDAILELLR